ncbi:four helix bundle protein [Chryseobacterium cucumeris]|uniref:Four helix bundle protein n=2 Tax=Chryseobacterium group TaxID=2782232 RepID=A0ABX9X6E3_9FLAO|nr:four helix bundle protein [Chryseobacterium sp. PCH239]RKE79029.1 four helix bundle protein [Chryseobacterium sp. AG363]ROH92268.1 four helix bundle protein [Chryseobacterium cucumeris]
MGNYMELIVWNKSVDLVTEIYSVTTIFPKEELYGLTSQIRRASISVPSNIAEGHSRRSTSDYLQFLKIARGSCAELETQLIISKNLSYLSSEKFKILIEKTSEISKMLNAIITKLQTP